MIANGAKMPRTYERFSGGAITTGILALLLVGVFAAMAFIPLFVLAGDGTSPSYVSGLDLFYYAFRSSFTKDLYYANPKLLFFDMGVSSYSGQNVFFTFLKDYHSYFEMGLIAVLMVAIVFAVIVAIFGIIILTVGRVRNTLMVSSLTSSALFSTVGFFTLCFLYFFICHKMFLEMGANVAVKIHYFSFIILGVVLALAITLRVIYNVSFKGKRFIGDVKRQMQAHNNAPYVSSQEPPREYPRVAPRPLANDLPPDISEIGENAFAMNTNLKNILIPEGILYLGAGAFSNCLNLESVTIPHSVRNIGYNCFFNTPKLKEIDYLGTAQEFEMISKDSNWLTLSSAHIVKTRNGTITIDHQ